MQDLNYLPEILILLGTSIFIVVLMHKMKLSPVLGYLVLGAVLGNYDIISDAEYTRSLAEFGIVFLLFVIGLELTFERLIRMRIHVFGFGGLQILITTIAMAVYCVKIFDLEPVIGVVIGAALSLSSTAIVMQVLNENNRQSTQVGRLSISMLLMQDLAVVPLLAILPILASGGTTNIAPAIGLVLIKAIFIIFAIIVAGRVFLRPLFSIIVSTKKNEVYLNTALFIVLGAAWLTSKYGLSTAMGAFLAGLLIAETEYRNKIEDSILPFQGLFLALFFIVTGMSIDIGSMIDNFEKVLLFSTMILVTKSVIIFLLCKLFKFSIGSAINSSLLLSQCGEFAFILFGLANQQKIIDDELTQLLLMVTAFTMAVTPLLAILGNKIEDFFETGEELDHTQEFKGVSDLHSHIIIAGFGRVGRMVAYILEQKQISYVGLDSNIALVKQVRALGYPVYHGDMASIDTLRAIGIKRASTVILSMDDKTSLRKATKIIAKEFKNISIIARVEDAKHAKGIRKLGATFTVPSTIETGIQLASTLMHNMNIPEHEIISIKSKLRKNEYSLTEEIELSNGMRKIPNLNTKI